VTLAAEDPGENEKFWSNSPSLFSTVAWVYRLQPDEDQEMEPDCGETDTLFKSKLLKAELSAMAEKDAAQLTPAPKAKTDKRLTLIIH
jgi:hypothetical protein